MGFSVNKREGLPEKGEYRKFSISLSEETESQLDDLQRTIRKNKGFRVSKSEIIRASIRFVLTLKPDLKNVKDETDLLTRLKKAAE